eukprot:4983785-Amphidinium_carterae.1
MQRIIANLAWTLRHAELVSYQLEREIERSSTGESIRTNGQATSRSLSMGCKRGCTSANCSIGDRASSYHSEITRTEDASYQVSPGQHSGPSVDAQASHTNLDGPMTAPETTKHNAINQRVALIQKNVSFRRM